MDTKANILIGLAVALLAGTASLTNRVGGVPHLDLPSRLALGLGTLNTAFCLAVIARAFGAVASQRSIREHYKQVVYPAWYVLWPRPDLTWSKDFDAHRRLLATMDADQRLDNAVLLQATLMVMADIKYRHYGYAMSLARRLGAAQFVVLPTLLVLTTV